MAVDGFDDSVQFALRNLQKQTLELTVHQKEAMKSILIGKDTLVCLPTGHGYIHHLRMPAALLRLLAWRFVALITAIVRDSYISRFRL